MNKRSLGVAAVFLVGCAVGGVSSQLVVPRASAQQAATLTKWEYSCFTGFDNQLNEAANRFGAQSWEMVGVARETNLVTTCFKRPRM